MLFKKNSILLFFIISCSNLSYAAEGYLFDLLNRMKDEIENKWKMETEQECVHQVDGSGYGYYKIWVRSVPSAQEYKAIGYSSVTSEQTQELTSRNKHKLRKRICSQLMHYGLKNK